MNTQALQAAQNFMCATVDIPYEYGGGYCEEHQTTFDRFCPAAVSIVEKLTPHIEAELRTKIAAEIRTSRLRPANNWGSHDAAVLEGLDLAARIAEGKQ